MIHLLKKQPQGAPIGFQDWREARAHFGYMQLASYSSKRGLWQLLKSQLIKELLASASVMDKACQSVRVLVCSQPDSLALYFSENISFPLNLG